MTVIGALSSFRELGEMNPHKRASILGTATRHAVEIQVAVPTFEDLSLLSGRQAATHFDAPSQSNCDHALEAKA